MPHPENQLLTHSIAAFVDASAKRGKPTICVGLDGFIDEIVHIVDKRESFERYTPIRTIADYAVRLAQAAGRSTNVELVLLQTKMGGNAPLMADALGLLGGNVKTIGALGHPTLHPVFEGLAAHGEAISLCDPAVTIAAEFADGKIMHGKLETLNDITFAAWEKAVGGRHELIELLAGADMLSLVNWTMIPRMTEVWGELLPVLAEMGERSPRHVFFDLCDPQKRGSEDIARAIRMIALFADTGARPILGLNEKESAEVCQAFGLPLGATDEEGLLARARLLSDTTGIAEIVIHPHSFAVAVSPEGDGVVHGPVCKSPKLTTGAGDSFNGGYCMARMLGLDPRASLAIGKGVSGYYVRVGRAPSPGELARFFERWLAGTLDPW